MNFHNTYFAELENGFYELPFPLVHVSKVKYWFSLNFEAYSYEV